MREGLPRAGKSRLAAQSARKKARTPDTVPRRGRIIRLLVGGREHATTRDTLSMVPDSFLDRLVSGELPSTLDEQGRIDTAALSRANQGLEAALERKLKVAGSAD